MESGGVDGGILEKLPFLMMFVGRHFMGFLRRGGVEWWRLGRRRKGVEKGEMAVAGMVGGKAEKKREWEWKRRHC